MLNERSQLQENEHLIFLGEVLREGIKWTSELELPEGGLSVSEHEDSHGERELS